MQSKILKFIPTAYLTILLLSLFFLFLPFKALARDPQSISDWYIQNFQSDIVVNKDSTLTITEKITADCGNLPDKHGILRVLPTQMSVSSSKSVETPIELESITDFAGNKLKYSTIKNRSDHTLTWKIGNPKVTVHGVNNYLIKYKVKNVIRFNNSAFDELYWNLNGNFWKIDTDKFNATLHFPSEINESNTKLSLYSGTFGSKSNPDSQPFWSGSNLTVNHPLLLKPGEGITVSAAFPKDIISAYHPTLFEQYGRYFWFLIPLVALIVCLVLWSKYGNDPGINSAVAPEFEIPDKLSPIKMGMIMSNGTLKSQYISAEIINLATKGFIKIEEISKKTAFKKADYSLTLLKTIADDPESKLLIDNLFLLSKKGEAMRLSSLENKFYIHIKEMEKEISNDLVLSGYLLTQGRNIRNYMYVVSHVILIAAFFLFRFDSFQMEAFASFVLLYLFMLVFAYFMPKMTQKGAAYCHRVKGFRLYMDKAEKYRDQFYEKENIFEKLLPYAIMFGMTKEWIKKIDIIYGKEYFQNYHPVWFYGNSFHSFESSSFENAFTAALNNLSSNMNSTLSSNPSSSGSGGGGFSGGGGGGGGGGGW